ncbi:hypothetical protein OS493_037584 [Desmophyllum pertusum]|uniref:Uncharacterized protein n=1 Tax=Desmophyllum pertusum TaxID=174260 RepID=A0A9W9YAA8_9CNID|nr:hypothetical protein OS493_037584 [Desmophyllum pertusum]
MNKKRFTDFGNYLEGFTQRIVQRYPNTNNFIDQEKRLMLERFPELGLNVEESQQHNQYNAVKHTLDLSVNNERRKCYHDIEIKRETPENCVESIIFYRKRLETHIVIFYIIQHFRVIYLWFLRSISTPEGFRLHLRKTLDITVSHAKFVMAYHELVTTYPRLLMCELPQRFFC